jgi:hypothetical protein
MIYMFVLVLLCIYDYNYILYCNIILDGIIILYIALTLYIIYYIEFNHIFSFRFLLVLKGWIFFKEIFYLIMWEKI